MILYVRSIRETSLNDDEINEIKTLHNVWFAEEAITLYVSTNQTKSGQYRLWRQSADGSNEWSNMFAFSAFIKPTGNYTFPIYVFTAGGSPYWRQYISGESSPPSTEYRLDYMFYCSQSTLPGTQQYHVQEAGSVPVIRSYVSKTKTIPGWKYKGLSFFAPKHALGGDKTCTYKGNLFLWYLVLKVFYWTRRRHVNKTPSLEHISWPSFPVQNELSNLG